VVGKDEHAWMRCGCIREIWTVNLDSDFVIIVHIDEGPGGRGIEQDGAPKATDTLELQHSLPAQGK